MISVCISKYICKGKKLDSSIKVILVYTDNINKNLVERKINTDIDVELRRVERHSMSKYIYGYHINHPSILKFQHKSFEIGIYLEKKIQFSQKSPNYPFKRGAA